MPISRAIQDIAFRVSRNYTNRDFTTETFITEYGNTLAGGSSGFDLTAGTFTVPVGGIYQINVQHSGTSNYSAANNVIMKLYENGTALAADTVRDDPEGGQSANLIISQTRKLIAGEVLKVSFQVTNDTSVGANFLFSGHLVG